MANVKAFVDKPNPRRHAYHDAVFRLADPILPLNTTDDVPAALSAFLRGVERRGVVLAELQCGRRDTGEIALAAALRAFRQYASEQPMAAWPRGFWSLLVAAPPLRQAHPEARWPDALDHLADLADDDRLALLLRLVAGLDEEDAGAVLGVDQAGYRQALARACPRDAEGQPDADAWRALAEAIQQHLRALPPERLAHLSRLRESLVQGQTSRPAPPTQAPAATPAPAPEQSTRPRPAARPRRARGDARPFPWGWVLGGLVALCALAAAGWWFTHGGRLAAPATAGAPSGDRGQQGLQDAAQVQVDTLSGDDEAGVHYDDPQVLLSHPDFDLLMDPDGLALARRSGMLSWYAAAPQDRQREAAEAMAGTAQERDDATP